MASPRRRGEVGGQSTQEVRHGLELTMRTARQAVPQLAPRSTETGQSQIVSTLRFGRRKLMHTIHFARRRGPQSASMASATLLMTIAACVIASPRPALSAMAMLAQQPATMHMPDQRDDDRDDHPRGAVPPP